MEREVKDIDQKLEALEPMRKLIEDLPEDGLSMAWRADLNEKLRALAPTPKSRTWGWLWKPAAGLGLASVLAVAILIKSPSANPSTAVAESAIAQAMLEAHQQSVAQQELETVSTEALGSDTSNVPFDWNESDLTTL